MSELYEIKLSVRQIILNVLMFIISLSFILPLCLIITASLAGKESLVTYGYTFFPKVVDWSAYLYIFKNPSQIINSYITTAFVSAVTCVFGTLIMCITAYPISKKTYFAKKSVTFFIFFTMLFGGG